MSGYTDAFYAEVCPGTGHTLVLCCVVSRDCRVHGRLLCRGMPWLSSHTCALLWCVEGFLLGYVVGQVRKLCHTVMTSSLVRYMLARFNQVMCYAMS